MSLTALRDAIDLLTSRPVIWIPGIACGLLAVLLWTVLYYSGTFFAARLFVLLLLASVFFIAAIYVAIRQDAAGTRDVMKTSASYYFRVLTPTLVIAFGTVLVFLLIVATLAVLGMPPDTGVMTFLTFGVVLPTIMLTFFYDCAAVFDDRKVFESLQRSIEVVTANLFSVLVFYIGCFLIFCTVSFAIFVGWTAVLADRLEPIAQYSEAQIAELTPDQLLALIGYDGFVASAVCIFAAVAILLPLLYTYKACFYRIVSGTTPAIRQVGGEYDEKGRWYKY